MAMGSILAGISAIALLPLGNIVVEAGYNVLILSIAVCIVGGLGSWVVAIIHLGIQCVYAPVVLPRLFQQCRILDNVHYKFDCAHTGELAEKIKSGFVDLTFMIGASEPRRNLIDEWTEKFVWVRAPHHRSVAEDGTIPFVARQDGLMDRAVFKLLDERGIPYRIVFSATDIVCMYAGGGIPGSG